MLDIDGVRLHYVERGEGPPVVLLHGNTVSLADFEASGLIDRLAATPPRDRLRPPRLRPQRAAARPPVDADRQARLLHAALARLGVERPVVVGHSMGTLVALAHGARPSRPRCAAWCCWAATTTRRVRVDALLTAPVALPVLGDVMRYTVTAMSAGRC